MKSDKIEKD
jgi:hypothetical protein